MQFENNTTNEYPQEKMPKKYSATMPMMRSTSLTQSKDIQYPGIHDVLCGRGGHAMSHPGNLKYRTLIDSCKPRYNQATTQYERSKIAANIVTMWRSQNPEGRFLTKTYPLQPDSVWHDIGNKDAIKKVSQTLRERRSYPMLSTTGIATNCWPIQPHDHSSPQQQQQQKPPQPIVDAIIASAQQQEQLEKIRLIEEEIKQLQQKNLTQSLIEQQLRQQQILHHPKPENRSQECQQQQQQEQPMLSSDHHSPGCVKNTMTIPEGREQGSDEENHLPTIESDQPMDDVDNNNMDTDDNNLHEDGGHDNENTTDHTPSRQSLWKQATGFQNPSSTSSGKNNSTTKSSASLSLESLWAQTTGSSDSFSLGKLLDSERSSNSNNINNNKITKKTEKKNDTSTTSSSSSNNSFFSLSYNFGGGGDDKKKSSTAAHHTGPDRVTSDNSTISTQTKLLLNESIHSISDREGESTTGGSSGSSSRSFGVSSSSGGGGGGGGGGGSSSGQRTLTTTTATTGGGNTIPSTASGNGHRGPVQVM